MSKAKYDSISRFDCKSCRYLDRSKECINPGGIFSHFFLGNPLKSELFCANFTRKATSNDGILQAETLYSRLWISSWDQYLGEQDWAHDRVFSSAARLSNYADVPQDLLDMTSDVPTENASYFDWMAGTNDVRGYLVRVSKPNKDILEITVNLNFSLVDFKIFFPGTGQHYGFSNSFSEDVNPVEIINAFWAGRDDADVRARVDALISGRLDSKI